MTASGHQWGSGNFVAVSVSQTTCETQKTTTQKQI